MEPEPKPVAAVSIAITAGAGPPYVTATQDGKRKVECELGLTAVASGSSGGAATWLDGTVRWFAGADRHTPVDSTHFAAEEVRRGWGAEKIVTGQTQRAHWSMWASVPFKVTFDMRYRPDGTDKVQTATFSASCGPEVPPGGVPAPVVTDLTLSPAEGDLEPSDTLMVTYRATSSLGLWETVISVTGAYTAEQRVLENSAKEVTRTLRLPIPPHAELGSPVRVSVTTMDAALQQGMKGPIATRPLVDRTPPHVLRVTTRDGLAPGEMATLVGSYAPGDTLKFWATTADNHRLGYLVYELGAPANVRDSLQLHGSFVQGATVRIPIRSEWIGTPRLRVYVRDSVGLKGPEYTSLPDSIRIYSVAERPTRVASLNTHHADAVLDSLRGRLYLSMPGHNEIAVLSLANMTFDSPIPLPSPPAAMDLSLSGDSLLVVLPRERAIAVVDLSRSSAAPVLVPLTPSPIYFLQTLRVAANGKALLTFNLDDRGTGAVLEVNFATGEQRIRTDVESYVASAGVVQMARTPDRSRVVVNGHCAQLYLSATDRFAPCKSMLGVGPLSSDAVGRRYARGLSVYDAELNAIRRIAYDGATHTTGVSPDGEHLYVSTSFGLVKVRIVDGAVVDRSKLPPIYGRILFAQGGAFLIAINNDVDANPRRTQIFVVDLR